jgi:hypothetical protein
MHKIDPQTISVVRVAALAWGFACVARALECGTDEAAICIASGVVALLFVPANVLR